MIVDKSMDFGDATDGHSTVEAPFRHHFVGALQVNHAVQMVHVFLIRTPYFSASGASSMRNR
jgi:hypothetical protein